MVNLFIVHESHYFRALDASTVCLKAQVLLQIFLSVSSGCGDQL